MTPRCHRCDRHLIDEPIRCPFCRATQRVSAVPPMLCALVGLSLVGCTNRVGTETSDGQEAGGTSQGSSTTGGEASSAASSASAGATTVDPTISTVTTTTTATSDGSTSTTGDAGSTFNETTSTSDTGNEDTLILPYAGAYPDPESGVDDSS